MSTIALGISYDGSDFHGWQRQSTVSSIQACLEKAGSQVANHPIKLTSAGRTDVGVHATGQVAAFSSPAVRQEHEWLRGFNALTPPSIRVNWVQSVQASFHPRYHAVARRYVYVFHDIGFPDPLLANRVWSCPALDADAMHQAAQVLLGEHDFSAFRGAQCQSVSPRRRVDTCQVMRRGAFVVLDISANAFLLHMVRNIAGALCRVGTGEGRQGIKELLMRRDRAQIGATAPAHGLYFVHASYPLEQFPRANLPAILYF